MSSEFPSLRGEMRSNRAVIATSRRETRPGSERAHRHQPAASQPDWLVTSLKGRVRERARL